MEYSSWIFLCCLSISAIAVSADDDPMAPLNRRVGTWVNKTYQKKAEWTPKETSTTGEETVKWVLDKKFIQGDAVNADGSKGHWLMNYDEEAETYRTWFFGNRNQFPTSNTVGRWDPKAERMTMKQDLGNNLRAELTLQFMGTEKMEWKYTIRDNTGKLMLHSGGTQTRKK